MTGSIRFLALAIGMTAVAGVSANVAAAAHSSSMQVSLKRGRTSPIPLLDKPANAVIERMNLTAALLELSRASGVVLNYSDDLIHGHRIVDCACRRVAVGDALARMLSGTQLRFVEMRSHVLIEPSEARDAPARGRPPASFAVRGADRSTRARQPVLQDTVIAGTVVDARSQRPVAGAQVMIAGTSRGALTDSRGRFRIDALPANRVTLRVTMIGYHEVEEVVAAGETDIRIALDESAIQLDRIVVTGTPGGTQRRAIGNAVSQVNAAELAEIAPPPDVQSMLSTQVPGLRIMRASGQVGAGGSTRIRGVSSISLSNEPLVYIDGIRVDNDAAVESAAFREGDQPSRINDINPDDIESIEVIKGPAARERRRGARLGGTS